MQLFFCSRTGSCLQFFFFFHATLHSITKTVYFVGELAPASGMRRRVYHSANCSKMLFYFILPSSIMSLVYKSQFCSFICPLAATSNSDPTITRMSLVFLSENSMNSIFLHETQRNEKDDIVRSKLLWNTAGNGYTHCSGANKIWP